MATSKIFFCLFHCYSNIVEIKTQTIILNNLISFLRFKVYKFKMKRFDEIESEENFIQKN